MPTSAFPCPAPSRSPRLLSMLTDGSSPRSRETASSRSSLGSSTNTSTRTTRPENRYENKFPPRSKLYRLLTGQQEQGRLRHSPCRNRSRGGSEIARQGHIGVSEAAFELRSRQPCREHGQRQPIQIRFLCQAGN